MTKMSNRLVILDIVPSSIPSRSSLVQNNSSKANKVTFSKHNQSPGTTRNIVNRFQSKRSSNNNNSRIGATKPSQQR
ncbi:hypothetical protein PS6_009147 [Mucor atramentarius]